MSSYTDAVREGLEDKSIDQVKTMRWACSEGELDLVKSLVKQGIDVNIDYGRPLDNAVKFNQIDVIRYLIEQGANVNRTNNLSHAVVSDNYGMVKLLLENGANIHAQEDSALFSTCDHRGTEMLELLLENGANVHARNNSIIYESVERSYARRYEEKLEILKRYGATLEYRDDLNLAYAALSGDLSTVNELLDKGTDVNSNCSDALKKATVETGVEINVPLFINQGDKVKVDTRTGDYIERVK